MEDGVAGPDGGVLTAKRLPCEPDARLEGGLVHLNAAAAVAADADACSRQSD